MAVAYKSSALLRIMMDLHLEQVIDWHIEHS